jgi:7,8-dihydropterin-6-yl-methyl-4-(beta-D-ribofuranosyl)aminobenzene 5'-phosphate synthase
MVEHNMEDFKKTVCLKEIDSVEIMSLVDNSVDFTSTIDREEVQQVREWIKKRKDEDWVKKHFRLPLAEHGYSALVRISCDEESHSILFDCGGSPDGVVTNIERMGLDLSGIESIVLSHGHYDHCGGLTSVLKIIDRDLPVIVHEDMFKTRGVINPDGTIRKYPDFPTENMVKPAKYIRTKEPHLVADDAVLVTGEIPRVTDFEKGFLQQRTFIDGKWLPDPYVWDDRAIILNVKNKGLIILSGCAHAGIINTILYARKITGINNIIAVIGGFHLSGKEYEDRINDTVIELKRINPALVVPTHCTGWRGFTAIREALPQTTVWNSVGNLYRL